MPGGTTVHTGKEGRFVSAAFRDSAHDEVFHCRIYMGAWSEIIVLRDPAAALVGSVRHDFLQKNYLDPRIMGKAAAFRSHRVEHVTEL